MPVCGEKSRQTPRRWALGHRDEVRGRSTGPGEDSVQANTECIETWGQPAGAGDSEQGAASPGGGPEAWWPWERAVAAAGPGVEVTTVVTHELGAADSSMCGTVSQCGGRGAVLASVARAPWCCPKQRGDADHPRRSGGRACGVRVISIEAASRGIG